MEHFEDNLKIVEAALGNRIAVRVHSKDGQILEASQIGIFATPVHKIDGKKVGASKYQVLLMVLVESKNLKDAEFGFVNRYGVFVPFIFKEGGG